MSFVSRVAKVLILLAMSWCCVRRRQKQTCGYVGGKDRRVFIQYSLSHHPNTIHPLLFIMYVTPRPHTTTNSKPFTYFAVTIYEHCLKFEKKKKNSKYPYNIKSKEKLRGGIIRGKFCLVHCSHKPFSNHFITLRHLLQSTQ